MGVRERQVSGRVSRGGRKMFQGNGWGSVPPVRQGKEEEYGKSEAGKEVQGVTEVEERVSERVGPLKSVPSPTVSKDEKGLKVTGAAGDPTQKSPVLVSKEVV